MRAERLVSILLLLQTRGRMTAPALARELEVSVRTVYRDIESLSAAGVPVYADRGTTGGYQLVDGYRTRLTGMTTDEAEALFLTGIPGPAAELGLGTVLAAAELKLQAALPPELRARAGRIRERFHLDVPAWFRDADDTPHLEAVADAVWNQRVLRVEYRRWQAPREVTRTIEPLGIVLKAGTWYLVARSSGQLRTYRVAHVLAVEPLDETFDRPADFDLATYWDTWSRHFEDSVHRDHALVRLTPAGVARASILLGPVVGRVVEAAASAAATPHADVEVTIPVESMKHAHVELLKLGTDVEVLGPPELRAAVAATVHTLAGRYPAPT